MKRGVPPLLFPIFCSSCCFFFISLFHFYPSHPVHTLSLPPSSPHCPLFLSIFSILSKLELPVTNFALKPLSGFLDQRQMQELCAATPNSYKPSCFWIHFRYFGTLQLSPFFHVIQRQWCRSSTQEYKCILQSSLNFFLLCINFVAQLQIRPDLTKTALKLQPQGWATCICNISLQKYLLK